MNSQSASAWLGAILWTAALGTAVVGAADKPLSLSTAQQEKLMEHVRGNFDMSRNLRPYAVYLVLDQQGNRLPSFWCGRNLEGQIRFNGQVDPLEDKIQVAQDGAFTVQITNAARKYGLFDKMPGGLWAEKLSELNFRLRFEKFTDVQFAGVTEVRGERGHPGQMITLSAQCQGTVWVGNHQAPFAGRARLQFSDHKELFLLQASFDFPGQALGLTGPAGTGITATLYTSSTPAISRPNPTP